MTGRVKVVLGGTGGMPPTGIVALLAQIVKGAGVTDTVPGI
jgi:hypothetical protein